MAKVTVELRVKSLRHETRRGSSMRLTVVVEDDDNGKGVSERELTYFINY